MKKIFILALFFAFTVQYSFSQFFVGGGFGVLGHISNTGGPAIVGSAEAGYRFPHRFFSVGMIVKYGIDSAQHNPIFNVGVFGEGILFTFGRRSSFVVGLSFAYTNSSEVRIFRNDHAAEIGLPLMWEVSLGEWGRTALFFRLEPMLVVGNHDINAGFNATPIGLRVFFW